MQRKAGHNLSGSAALHSWIILDNELDYSKVKVNVQRVKVKFPSIILSLIIKLSLLHNLCNRQWLDIEQFSFITFPGAFIF